MPDNDWKVALERRIGELRTNSQFARSTHEGRKILRLPSGEQFFVRRIVDPEDPDLLQAHRLLQQNFSPEETDPLEVFCVGASREGKGYYIVQDDQGDVLSLGDVTYLPLCSRDGGRIDQGALFVGYIVTHEDARKRGFASELYQEFYQWTRDCAHAAGHRLWGVIGETVPGVERFLNGMGRKRVYFEDVTGNVYEVPYLQPPCDWDSRTGNPLLNPKSEHLMVWRTDEQEKFPASDLLSVVEALYEQTYPSSREFFESDEAYQVARRVVQGILAELEKVLVLDAQDGEVFLMSKDERARRTEALIGLGLSLHEHSEA